VSHERESYPNGFRIDFWGGNCMRERAQEAGTKRRQAAADAATHASGVVVFDSSPHSACRNKPPPP
jgi:hypothetical protein